MVIFVVTNYNNYKYTSAMLESLLEYGNDFRFIVVDNASSDEDRRKLRQLDASYVQVHVIFSDTNCGYSAGLNLGIEHVISNKYVYDVLVVGNNDLVFKENIFKQLEECREVIKKYPVVCPDISLPDGSHQNPHVISGVSRFREMIYDVYYFSYFFSRIISKIAYLTRSFTDRKDERFFDIPQLVYQGYGACYILSSEFISKYGSIRSRTFMMYEEYFLAQQLAEQNDKMYYEPRIKVVHEYHAATGAMKNIDMWRIARRSHLEYRKHVKGFFY